MKYSTSPPISRCNSPSSQLFYSNSSTSMPMPATYRHNCTSAASKCYKYLRKLLKFEQMDFEFALWQIIYLLVSPQKVYRNFQTRKRTKSQFARDDPAFLVLFGFWLLLSSIIFAIVLRLSFVQFIKFLFYITVVDCIGVGICIATILWYVANHYLRYDTTQDVEWGYAFDIHLNAFFPPLILLHILPMCLSASFLGSDSFTSRFLGNTTWLVAIGYYLYITFLGYTSIEILHRTDRILWALPIFLIIYIVLLCIGMNLSCLLTQFYIYRL